MTVFLKLLLTLSIAIACFYGMHVFGVSFWPLLFLGAGSIVLLSVFLPGLNPIAKPLGIIVGLLSLAAFLLLMLAATTGGSFHLSPSNEILAVMLALMALFGSSAFFWSSTTKNNQP